MLTMKAINGDIMALGKVLPGAKMSSLTNKNPVKTVILLGILYEINVI